MAADGLVALMKNWPRLKDALGGSKDLLDQGFRTLEWLFKIQTDADDGHLCPIGNDGWYPRAGNKAKFDQQPGDVSSLIDAAREAYLVTGDEIWHDLMLAGLNWFLGSNDHKEPLFDFTTAGCCDGLDFKGVNANQGAEATLAWLLSLQNVYFIEQNLSLLRKVPGELDEAKLERGVTPEAMIEEPSATTLLGDSAVPRKE